MTEQIDDVEPLTKGGIVHFVFSFSHDATFRGRARLSDETNPLVAAMTASVPNSQSDQVTIQ